MKEHVEYIVDSFTDYTGKEHKFVIVALSQYLPTCTKELDNSPVDSNVAVTHEVGVYVQDYGTEDYLGTVTKVLKLGVSICNPTDTFNEEIGVRKAVSRAEKSKPVLYAANAGVINSLMVKGLLEQEARHLKDCPELFIEGYAEMRDRYLLHQEMISLKEGFTEVENTIVTELEKDPTYLNKVVSYFNWWEKYKKGCPQ